ncbi:carbohydrate sulfotransferase [Plakobranchus ocellatus]|uniref:Carbohydrate sulfotransferase n=1 Tax=Plakobranchus ocellatus TaxID=259542 RepID=A0AAV4BR18_9GAST|nr:carbohydrate sulfotransferase [Plakobranchus ocellatus]
MAALSVPDAGPAVACGPTAAQRSASRTKAWRQACRTDKLRLMGDGQVLNHLYSDKDKRFVFCSVPKVTDIFWKQVIRYINNSSQRLHGSPMDLPKWQTFYVPRSEQHKLPVSTIRFLFGEDPYMRLWKIWVEKFFLMSYWFKNFEDTAEPKDTKPKCRPDVSFAEFLRMVTQERHLEDPTKMNVHWRPQVYICDICKLKPNFVGKMETFEEDAQCLLSLSNYSWVLRGEKAKHTSYGANPDRYTMSSLRHRQTALRSMRSLIMENLAHWYTSTAARECISLRDLVRRLWKAFQFRGYLPPHINVPQILLSQNDIQVEDVLKECSQGLFMWSGSTFKVRQRKRRAGFRKMVLNAYKSVDPHTLGNVMLLYEGDFESLGYEKMPKDIFDDRIPFED